MRGPGEVAGNVVGGAVATAGAIATAPFRAFDNSYDNLTVAGDWTACGLISGCVEAAVISGRLAAHALSGSPRLEDIVGFDHP